MNIAKLMICVFSLIVGLGGPNIVRAAPPGVVEDAVHHLQDASYAWTDESLKTALALLEPQLQAEQDARIADALLRIVQDPSRQVIVRVEVFRALVRAAPLGRSDQVFNQAADAMKSIENQSVWNGGPNQGVLAFDLARAFIEAGKNERWARAFGNRLETADILARAYRVGLYTMCGNEIATRPDLVLLIKSAGLSEQVRERFAETVLVESRTLTEDRRICDMLSESSVTRLRSLLALADGAGPTLLPCGAAFALAHRGNELTVPILEALATSVEKPRPDDVGAASFRPRMAKQLRSYVAMIRAQYTPGGLVSLIEDEKYLDISDAWLREWALSRAVQIGIDRQQLLSALRHYADAVRASVGKQSVSRFKHPPLLALEELELRAVQLGVVPHDDDAGSNSMTPHKK